MIVVNLKVEALAVPCLGRDQRCTPPRASVLEEAIMGRHGSTSRLCRISLNDEAGLAVPRRSRTIVGGYDLRERDYG